MWHCFFGFWCRLNSVQFSFKFQKLQKLTFFIYSAVSQFSLYFQGSEWGTETIPSPNLFHSSQTLLANLNFPTSKRYLFLNSLKLCPLLAPSPITWKNLSGGKFSKSWRPRSGQPTGIESSEPQDPQPVLITILPQTLHHPGRSPLHLQLVYILPVVRSPCLHSMPARSNQGAALQWTCTRVKLLSSLCNWNSC